MTTHDSMSNKPTATSMPIMTKLMQHHHPAFAHQPNWAVKRTPILAMASPFSWPVLVPYAPAVLRRRLPW